MASVRIEWGLVVGGCMGLLACATARPEAVPLYGDRMAPEGRDAAPTAELTVDHRLCVLAGIASRGTTHQLPKCASRVTVPPGDHHLMVGTPVRGPQFPKMWFAVRMHAEAGERYVLEPTREFVPDLMPSDCVVTELRGLSPLKLRVRESTSGRTVGTGKRATAADRAKHPGIPYGTWEPCRQIMPNRQPWLTGGSMANGPYVNR